jgi:hypothetical protein
MQRVAPRCPVFSACSIGTSSSPLTSPMQIRSGRMRRACLTRSSSVISPCPSMFFGLVCRQIMFAPESSVTSSNGDYPLIVFLQHGPKQSGLSQCRWHRQSENFDAIGKFLELAQLERRWQILQLVKLPEPLALLSASE